MWSPTHVQVTVCRGKGLLTKGKNGTNDAFVTISLGKEKFQTSVKQKANQDVDWQEECELAIPTQGNTAEIVLTALHQNFIGVDEFLGMVTLPLSTFDVYDRPRNKWYALKSKPGQEGKSKNRGEIEIRVGFTVKSGSLLDLSKKEKHKGSFGHLTQAAHNIGGSLMSLGKEKKGGIKKLASSVGSKLRLPKGLREDKDGRLSRHSSGRYSGKYSNGEPDPGVISEDEDEFRFDELSHKSSGSSLNLAGGSSLASGQGSLENLGGGELLRQNSMKRSGSAATLPNRAIQQSSSSSSLVASKSPNQQQPDWNSKLFGNKQSKEAAAATMASTGVPSIIVQDPFIVEEPSPSPMEAKPLARQRKEAPSAPPGEESLFSMPPPSFPVEESSQPPVPKPRRSPLPPLEETPIPTPRKPVDLNPFEDDAKQPSEIDLNPFDSDSDTETKEKPSSPPNPFNSSSDSEKAIENNPFEDDEPEELKAIELNPFESEEPQPSEALEEAQINPGSPPNPFNESADASFNRVERENVLVLSCVDEEDNLDEDSVCQMLEKAIEGHDQVISPISSEPTVDFFNDQTVEISPVQKIDEGKTPSVRRDRLLSLFSTPNSEAEQPSGVIQLDWLEDSQGFGGSDQLSSALTSTSISVGAKTVDSAVDVSTDLKEVLNRPLALLLPPHMEVAMTPPLANLSWDNYDMQMIPTPTGRRSLTAPDPIVAEESSRRKRISLAPCLKTMNLDSPGGDLSPGTPIQDIEEDFAEEQAAKAMETSNETHRAKMAASFHQRVVVGEDKPSNNNTSTDSHHTPRDSPATQDRNRVYNSKSREGLINLLEVRDKEISDLKDYIDSLLLRVIDTCPTVLQTPIKSKTMSRK